MFLIIGLLGIVALMLAVIHLFYPKAIKVIDGIGKKTIEFYQFAEKHRVIFGIFYLLAGTAFIVYGFVFKSI